MISWQFGISIFAKKTCYLDRTFSYAQWESINFIFSIWRHIRVLTRTTPSLTPESCFSTKIWYENRISGSMRSVRPTFICNKSWPTLDSKRKNLLQVFRLYRIRTLSSGEFINILISIRSISSECFKVFIFGPSELMRFFFGRNPLMIFVVVDHFCLF